MMMMKTLLLPKEGTGCLRCLESAGITWNTAASNARNLCTSSLALCVYCARALPTHFLHHIFLLPHDSEAVCSPCSVCNGKLSNISAMPSSTIACWPVASKVLPFLYVLASNNTFKGVPIAIYRGEFSLS